MNIFHIYSHIYSFHKLGGGEEVGREDQKERGKSDLKGILALRFSFIFQTQKSGPEEVVSGSSWKPSLIVQYLRQGLPVYVNSPNLKEKDKAETVRGIWEVGGRVSAAD